jgi:uncharacterized protein YecE (DUF72 family)
MTAERTRLELRHDPAHDPGTDEARHRADAVAGAAVVPLAVGDSGPIRIGTAGWTDPTLTAPGVFYPEGSSSAEQRLRFYATRFSLVEVDSTYYALPARRMAELWVERTPDDFTFNLKAHALMTGQPTETSRLPRAIREALPVSLRDKQRIYGKDLPAELLDAVWQTYREALEPLRLAGKLGAVLMQYPRWFMPNRANSAEILRARERLAPLPMAVEVRNGRWLANADRATRLFAWLAEHDLSYVVVDQPQGLESSVPPISAVAAASLAIVRFHGRRAETWERPEVGVLERFRYLYDDSQLAEWAPRVVELSQRAVETHVIMNNCYANYGTTNAEEFAAILQRVAGAHPAG